jgi:DNA-directed RNA polymerase sigma subunit (sigma70/sigma32)
MVAACANCSRNRIHQIERKALAKVRRQLRRARSAGDLAEALKG